MVPTAVRHRRCLLRRSSDKTLSLADEAYFGIRDEILRGHLRPGTPLSRRRLAHHFGMSVLPVSGALRRLEEDGLVESRPRAGTRVRVPTETDVRELYELREALESQSARLFAQRATPRQRLELRRLAGQVDALFGRLATGAGDAGFQFTVHNHHVQFHMRIASLAGSRLLEQMIERKHVLILTGSSMCRRAGRRCRPGSTPGSRTRSSPAIQNRRMRPCAATSVMA